MFCRPCNTVNLFTAVWNLNKSPQAYPATLLLNSTLDKFPAHFTSCTHKSDSLKSVKFQCYPTGGTVAFLSYDTHAGNQDAVKACIVSGRALLFRGTLVTGLGTIFCSHTSQSLVKVQVSMSQHTRKRVKEEKGWREMETQTWIQEVWILHRCLLKQIRMTTSCRLCRQTKSVSAKPGLCVGGAPLLPLLKSPTIGILCF